MRTSRTFTKETAAEIVELLSRTRAADRDQQKILRQQIRDRGFYISDFSRAASGFEPEDFHDLVRRGVIRIM